MQQVLMGGQSRSTKQRCDENTEKGLTHSTRFCYDDSPIFSSHPLCCKLDENKPLG